MFNKEKFRHSIRNIALAIGLAFTGPIIFVWNLGHNSDNIVHTALSITGFIIMLGALYFGFKGIKQMLSSFFDHPNE